MPDQPLPPRFRLGSAEPRDAFEAFSARGLLAVTFNWWDVWQAEHAGAFMVSGIAQRDLLQLIRDMVEEALTNGTSFKDFAAALEPELVQRGWWGDVPITDPVTGEQRITRFNRARLELIYDTNMRQSYAAGRWQAAVRSRRRRPYLLYRTMRDERVRISHRPWDGIALPIDDPWWQTHYPPNGWRCRCRAISMSEEDLRRYVADGFDIKREAPPVQMVEYVDRRTGERATVPAGIDPGFAYNPGQARLGALRRLGSEGGP